MRHTPRSFSCLIHEKRTLHMPVEGMRALVIAFSICNDLGTPQEGAFKFATPAAAGELA